MRVLNFKDFIKNYNLKDSTMNESELQRVYNYSINPRDSLLINYEEKKYIEQYKDLK